jgi:hypothetical protein
MCSEKPAGADDLDPVADGKTPNARADPVNLSYDLLSEPACRR